MIRTLRAAILASLIIAAAWLVMSTETPKALALIFQIIVMVPLWFIDDLGFMDMGTDLNGFFLPNQAGYAIGASMFWCVYFLVIYMLWPGNPTKNASERRR